MLIFKKQLVSSSIQTPYKKTDHWFYKRAYESFAIQIDFSDIISSGDEIISGAVVCTDKEGSSVVGIATFDKIVQQNIQVLVSGGTLLSSHYNIFCRATVVHQGDQDSTYEEKIRMGVVNESDPGIYINQNTYIHSGTWLG